MRRGDRFQRGVKKSLKMAGLVPFRYVVHLQGKYESDTGVREISLSCKSRLDLQHRRSAFALKHIDSSFEWLDKAAKAAPGVLANIDADADLENVRRDARFASFAIRLTEQ